MTDLPPFDDDWNNIFITLDGRGGAVMTMGKVNFHVRNWQQLNAGQIRAQTQPFRDAEWEAFLERLAARKMAG